MRIVFRLFLLMLLVTLFGATLANADVMIGFAPSSQTVTLGQNASVDIVISGLPALGLFGFPVSIGAFDVTIGFDAGILGTPTATFGSYLGNLSTEAVYGVSAVNAGNFQVWEISLLTFELTALQAGLDHFTLATITFGTLAAGTSPLGFTAVTVSDELGSMIPAQSNAASITVTSGGGPGPGPEPTQVPEPCSIVLIGSGLAMCRMMRRRFEGSRT